MPSHIKDGGRHKHQNATLDNLCIQPPDECFKGQLDIHSAPYDAYSIRRQHRRRPYWCPMRTHDSSHSNNLSSIIQLTWRPITTNTPINEHQSKQNNLHKHTLLRRALVVGIVTTECIRDERQAAELPINSFRKICRPKKLPALNLRHFLAVWKLDKFHNTNDR